MPQRLPLAARLASLHAELAAVVAHHAPTEAAVEAPFHGVSARSALQLAHSRGVVLATLGAAGVAVHEYAPAVIKKSVTGSGRAEKVQIESMVARLVGGGGPEGRADIADAIATALCHLFHAGTSDALRRAEIAAARS